MKQIVINIPDSLTNLNLSVTIDGDGARLINSSQITPAEIMILVCDYMNITIDTLLFSDRNLKVIVRTRRYCATFLKQFANLNLPAIAKILKLESHATVINSITKVNNLCEIGDKLTVKEYQEIALKIKKYVGNNNNNPVTIEVNELINHLQS